MAKEAINSVAAKGTAPEAGERGFGLDTIPVSKVSNPRLSKSGKSILFDRAFSEELITTKDGSEVQDKLNNGKLELAYAMLSQDVFPFLADANGKAVKAGQTFVKVQLPESMGLLAGRAKF